ncbi:MAG: hypothetical protein QM762_12520 [Chryseolinea sp.]
MSRFRKGKKAAARYEHDYLDWACGGPKPKPGISPKQMKIASRFFCSPLNPLHTLDIETL